MNAPIQNQLNAQSEAIERHQKEGIFDGISMDEYLNMRGFSASKAHTLLKYSPFHAWQGMKSEPSEASETGTAIHDALLEGVDRIVAIEADSWRTKAAKEARDEARAQGAIPLLAHKANAVAAAVASAVAHIGLSPLSGIFERGKPEQTIVWRDGDGDLVCKARPDWLTDDRDVLLHVKTTKGSASPDSWANTQLVQAGYDVAAAFYERGLMSCLPLGHPSAQHIFLVIEQNYPHGCSLVGLNPMMWDIAHGKVDRAIRTWQRCREQNNYPGYTTQIIYAEPRAWQMEEALENEDIESLSFEEKIELGGQA